MNPDVIKQTIQLFTNEPEKAKVSPVVKDSPIGTTRVMSRGSAYRRGSHNV